MKTIKYSFIGLVVASLGLTGCQDSYDAPGLETPEATMKPNTTIAEFKQVIVDAMAAEGSSAILVPKKDNGEDYIIHGRVVSCDASGNIYQSLAIQDETSAINLSITEGNMWTFYREGQDIVVNVTGLYMGAYASLYQVGWLGEYYSAPSITRMGWEVFKAHSQPNGLPDQRFQNVPLNGTWPSDRPYCIVAKDIGEIINLDPETTGLNVMSQLVEFDDVWFVEGGENTFAGYHLSNESRYITDAGGSQIALNNSGYSNFYNTVLPTGIGRVRGILSYFKGANSTSGSWQLLIRDINDVMFGDMPGFSAESALTVPEAISEENSGQRLWVKGYIVGSVAGAVSTVTSNDDIIWGPDAELDNTLVIAETPDVKDYAECLIVQLPAGSQIRRFVNLKDHPDVYGLELFVQGNLDAFMGMNGVTGCDNYFDIPGYEIGGEDGAGNEASPYSVTYVKNSLMTATDVWVQGYIVGFVEGTSFETGAVFGTPTDANRNYNGANVLISTSPQNADLNNSIPVAVDRATIGLKNHPENLGKYIKLKGNVGQMFGTVGMPTVTETKLGE